MTKDITQKMIEEITNKKHWVFKLRRLAGKDYIASFTKLGKRGTMPIEFISPPLAFMNAAIENSYLQVKSFLKGDNRKCTLAQSAVKRK